LRYRAAVIGSCAPAPWKVISVAVTMLLSIYGRRPGNKHTCGISSVKATNCHTNGVCQSSAAHKTGFMGKFYRND
jgi:hypothetical protein